MIFHTNVRGPFFLMQGVVRHLLETKKPGSIVNVLSMSAHCGQSFLAPYSSSKGALATLTKNVANAYRTNRIRVQRRAAGLDGHAGRGGRAGRSSTARAPTGWKRRKPRSRWASWSSRTSWQG